MPHIIRDLFRKPLPIGAAAPAIAGMDAEGRAIDLGELFRTGFTLVFFFPKAGTPSCTAQACSLRDCFSELASLGIQVAGVSTDSRKSQQSFLQHHRLPYILLADPDQEIARAFGVPVFFGFAARQSFLIQEGKIVWHCRRPKAGKHAEEVRKAVAGLRK